MSGVGVGAGQGERTGRGVRENAKGLVCSTSFEEKLRTKERREKGWRGGCLSLFEEGGRRPVGLETHEDEGFLGIASTETRVLLRVTQFLIPR